MFPNCIKNTRKQHPSKTGFSQQQGAKKYKNSHTHSLSHTLTHAVKHTLTWTGEYTPGWAAADACCIFLTPSPVSPLGAPLSLPAAAAPGAVPTGPDLSILAPPQPGAPMQQRVPWASSSSISASISASSWASLLESSRCFISTATTTLMSTNWAVSTKETKYIGEINWRVGLQP